MRLNSRRDGGVSKSRLIPCIMTPAAHARCATVKHHLSLFWSFGPKRSTGGGKEQHVGGEAGRKCVIGDVGKVACDVLVYAARVLRRIECARARCERQWRRLRMKPVFDPCRAGQRVSSWWKVALRDVATGLSPFS